MDLFISGLALGWLTELLLDVLFWRRRRVCPEVEQELRGRLDTLQAENGRLQEELSECRQDLEDDNQDDIEREWDNLTRIWGVGPKIAAILYLAGITSFEALARLEPGQIERVLSRGGERFRLSRYNAVESWPAQAHLAATERWAELEAMRDQLSHDHAHTVSGDDSHAHDWADQ